MPTNPPTPADRLAAAVPDTWLDPLLSGPEAIPGLDRCDGRVIEALCAAIRGRLTALLAADPPGATVTVLCAKCSGTDILTRYCGAGEHRYGYMTCVAPFDDKRNEPHATPLLHRHCRTCQWRWNDVPHDHQPITEE